jgi:ATP-binding cassette subfamily B protein
MRAQSVPEPFRTVQADNVTFRYPGRPTAALDQVNIEVNQGEVVALVGENGSGKTTLAKVIAGLYEPDSGVVRWDGVDVHALDSGQLRDQIAVIFSDFVRYALPARENIGLGRPDEEVDDQEVIRAARITDADGFLAVLPDGYATPLSRLFAGGHELSGGQWQRVALARAFYRRAPFVILDEPTAALDPRAEHELFASLRQTLHGRTALFISHRFSTVRTADRIYVLDQGRVVEHGNHDQLMVLGGRYAELFNLQAAAYANQQAPGASADGPPEL